MFHFLLSILIFFSSVVLVFAGNITRDQVTVRDSIVFQTNASPANAPSGYGRLFWDGTEFKIIDDAGLSSPFVLESDFVNGSLRYKDSTGTMTNIQPADNTLLGKDATTGSSEVQDLTVDEVQTLLSMDRRELLKNNLMEIWQAGTSFTVSSPGGGGVITADQWRVDWSTLSSGSLTVSRGNFKDASDFVITDVPDNPRYYLEYDRSAGVVTSTGAVGQRIEDVMNFAGQTVTATWWMRCNGCATAFNVSSGFKLNYGTGCSGGCSAETDSSLVNHSVSSTWTKYTRTFTLEALSVGPKKVGIDSFGAFRLEWSSSEGATEILNLAHFQLVYGNIEVPYEHKDLDAYLKECQRYRFKSFPLDTAPASAAGGTGAVQYTIPAASTGQRFSVPISYPTPMLCTGAIALYNPAGGGDSWYNFDDSASGNSASILFEGMAGFSIDGTHVAGDAAGERLLIHFYKACPIGPSAP